jgi:hypothetical protein
MQRTGEAAQSQSAHGTAASLLLAAGALRRLRLLRPALDTRPKKDPATCDHCGRGDLQLIGVATGKTTEIVPWVGKPHKYSVDWIQGGNRKSGKSTGRPKNAQPNDLQDRANDRARQAEAHPDDGGADPDDADGWA